MDKIVGGNPLPEDEEIQEGDEITIFKSLEEPYNYRTVTAGEGGSITFASNDKWALKFVKLPAGKIGAQQVAIETKQKMIATTQSELTKERAKEHPDENKIALYEAQIVAYTQDITDIENGTKDDQQQEVTPGLKKTLCIAVALAIEIDGLLKELDTLNAAQDAIESAFAAVMGDMLKDGYWSDNNYAIGQEQQLYWDALDRMNEVAKPTVKYTIGYQRMSEFMGGDGSVPEPNTAVKIFDEKLNIHDTVYVSKMSIYLDDPRKGSVELSNETIPSAMAKPFESMMSRVTDLADQVNQRSAVYERASAITKMGTLPAERIVGTISIQENEVESTTSNWYTDKDGGLVFESVLANSAYKFTGDGILFADSKEDGENWDWRLFGNGSGFDASALTGLLDSAVIGDGSIGTSKFTGGAGIGNQLDISHNSVIIDPQTGLQTRIDQVNGRVDTVVGDVTEINGEITSIEGSALWQNRNNITAAVGTMRVDSDGNLHIVEGSGLYMDKNSTSYGVWNDGNVTSGAIVTKINQGTDQILGNKLDVNTEEVAAWGAYTNNTLTGGILVEKLNDDSTTTTIKGSRVNITADQVASLGFLENNKLTGGVLVQKLNDGTVTTQIAGNVVDISANTSFSTLVGNVSGMNSRISQTENKIGLVVSDGGIRAASIVAAINDSGSSIVIDADHIDLRGLVTTQQLEAAFSTARSLTYLAAQGQTITNNGGIYSGGFYIKTSGDSVDVSSAIASFGTAVEQNGQITIPTKTLMNGDGPPINFNIADTNFYKQAKVSRVSVTLSGTPIEDDTGHLVQPGTANITPESGTSYPLTISGGVNVEEAVTYGINQGKTTGWNLAVGKVSVPSYPSSGSSISFSYPTSGYNSSSSLSLSLTGSRDTASLVGTHGEVYATVNTGAYTAGQNSVSVTKTWEENVCTCIPTPGSGVGTSITISQQTDSPTSTAPNLYRVTIKDGTTQVLYFVVDASARYTAGTNAVVINKGNWSANGTVEFTKSVGTGSAKSVILRQGTTTWSDNTATVKINDSSTYTNFDVTVDASTRYTAGTDAVVINKGTWSSNGTIEFTKSVGTGTAKSVILRQGTTTWDNNTATVKVNDSSTYTNFNVSVDASARYTAGVTEGESHFRSRANITPINGTSAIKIKQ